MQDSVIVRKLHITALQFHHQVKLRIISQLVQKIKRFDLRWRQRLNICKPASRFDVLPLIDCRKQSREPVENWNIEIRLFTFGNFTAAIRFNRLEQYSSKIRTATAHLVKDRG